MPSRRAFTAAQIARLRMQTLGLVGDTGLTSPRAVVEHHLAMQAQDFRASRWAIGSRLGSATDEDVIAAYDRGEIVRSWPMRGTVHVTLAEDMPWMLDLMGVRTLTGVKRRWENLGIDEDYLERARSVAIERLRGGGRCTRTEFSEALEEAGLEVNGQRLYHTVWYLSQTGTLIQGPTRDGDHLLVLLSEWVTNPRRLDRESALGELGRRYLRARGPASIDDLVHWTKLTKRDVREALDQGDNTIAAVDGPDGELYMLAEHLDTLDPDATSVDRSAHALAAFDEHLLGYRTRDAVLDPSHATLVDPARNGVFRWTLVSGGRVFATWKRIRKARRVVAEVSPFASVSAAVKRAAEPAIQRWSNFDGSPVEIVWPT